MAGIARSGRVIDTHSGSRGRDDPPKESTGGRAPVALLSSHKAVSCEMIPSDKRGDNQPRWS
jgi:hypothetical protein